MSKTFCTKGDIQYIDCSPLNRDRWFKNPVVKDPVYSNIKYGCWICNVEPRQSDNNKLCERFLFSCNVSPCDYPNVINSIRNIQKRNYKTHPIK
mgnify:CR=1 FL=1|tara:strand:- start:291 stop:572 length:282 start_codon:yes stop_codon:yes gene_type:complete